jgi:hypothetical protein
MENTMNDILFDLEGRIKEMFKPRTKLGLEQTGQRVRAPAADLPVPATVPSLQAEATPRTQQTEATKAQAQATPPNKNDLRVLGSPLRDTRNFERFVQ